MTSPADILRSMGDCPDPSTLAPDRDLCPCGAPLASCPECHGDGGWFDPEEPNGPCGRCRWTGIVCADTGCGGPTPRQCDSAGGAK